MTRLTPPVRGVSVCATRTGLGLVAGKTFARGARIGRIGGRVHHWRVLRTRGGSFLANCFRFDDDHYLDPLDGLGRYLNHSCAPNAAIRKLGDKLVLYAAARIAAGKEIVIDYSTITGDDDIYRMRCRCGNRRCRKWVSRFALLPRPLQERYLRTGMLPACMQGALEDENTIAKNGVLWRPS
jgi:hypothetical protein